MGTIKDITGQRFGRLVVIEKTEIKPNKGVYWKCKCDCGNVVEKLGCDLRSGNTKSCGCITKENLKKYSEKKMLDLGGKRFGKLTVVKSTNKKDGSNYIWECKCDCGNTLFVRGTSLVDGNTTSCGCNQRKIASEIVKIANKDCVEETKLSSLTLPKRKGTTSNIKGVFWNSTRKKWQAKIFFKGKDYHLGYFDDENDAGKARKRAEEDLFEPVLNKYAKELKGDD